MATELKFSLAVIGLIVGAPSIAWAIPSPELVIGSVASLSQMFALVAAMLGGGAVLAGAKSARSTGGSGTLWVRIALGALVMLGLSLAANGYQWSSESAARQARLESTLLRPSRQPGLPNLDPTDIELSFGQQVDAAHGISTADAEDLLHAKLRGDADHVTLIDVRETAETEMGGLPGASIARYPDFDAVNVPVVGRRIILFCHNGNRSSEVCAALAARGIDCRFIVGGLEKWVVEKRPMTGLANRTLDSLRAIPPYPAQDRLLDTADVKRLVEKESAIFVDVRYPLEFTARRIAGAVNLPIRRLPKAELARQISALPKQPIILPCYDRRSCFFAEVLGLELTRSGADVRGRYTAPWEYFIPSARPPHVDRWIAENRVSLWEKATAAVTSWLQALAAQVGLVTAIGLAALASRLAVLPFALKADRDQLMAKAVTAEIAGLKARITDNPRRLTRAIQAIYGRHGLTPVRNLAALLLLPVLAIMLAAVERAAAFEPGTVAWMPALTAADPTYALPVLIGVVLALYLHSSLGETTRARLVIWLVVAPLLAVGAAHSSAAGDLYLLASAMLLVAQRALVVGAPRRIWKALAKRMRQLRDAGLPSGIVSLADVGALRGTGNKALRLGQLKSHGVEAPHGYVLTAEYLDVFAKQSPAARQRSMRRLWRRLGCKPLAVRSSASGEDGAQHSFAGVFESVIEVDRDGLEAAVQKVVASFDTARGRSYSAAGGAANVLVQRMAPARCSGVLFTRAPDAGGAMLVELVAGTADTLVSGAETPRALRFGRYTRRPIGTAAPGGGIDFVRLLDIGMRAEALFGAPQDIEWAYGAGRFHIVQSRDITVAMPAVEIEWARLTDLARGAASDEIVLAQTELTELLPRPTPLSLSLMERLWASGGSIDRACERLGLQYRVGENDAPYLVTVFGRLYVNERRARASAPVVTTFGLRRLLARSDAIERRFVREFAPSFHRQMTVWDAVDFERMTTADLLAAYVQLRTSIFEDTHVEVDIINIAAHAYSEYARRELTKAGHDAVRWLAPTTGTPVTRAVTEARRLDPRDQIAALHASIGHRAVVDYELAEKRYAETPDRLAKLLATPTSADRSAELCGSADELGAAMARTVQRAVRFQALKDEAKHEALREFATLRRVCLAIDRRLELGGLLFQMTDDEIGCLAPTTIDTFRAVAQSRAEAGLAFATREPLAPQLRSLELEHGSSDGGAAAPASNRLGGTRVAGRKVTQGRARVIATGAAERGDEIGRLSDGDIIVARMIHPAWLGEFHRVGGLVCSVGGWLSHTAIVAREYDLALIVGVADIDSIRDGDLIELRADGSIEILQCADAGIRAAAAAE